MICQDIQDEAQRVVRTGDDRQIVLRVLGGLAVLIHSPSALQQALSRSYADIDLATPVRRSQPVETLFADLGYGADKTFNLFNGDTRLLFYDRENGRQIDVFIGGFEMCHRLPITERLSLEALTLPLAELLLTKLQIVQMNEKDVRDICALLIDHALGEADAETINLPRIAQLCAADWGLWRTVTLSLDKVQSLSNGLSLEPADKATIDDRLNETN